MEKVDIIALMEKHNLTLRRVSGEVRELLTYREGEPLKDGETIAEEIVGECTLEDFTDRRAKGFCCGCRWSNGFIVRMFVCRTKQTKEGWIVKQDNGHGSTQTWDIKKDWFAKTADGAVLKAVKDIEEAARERNEWRRLAGLDSEAV